LLEQGNRPFFVAVFAVRHRRIPLSKAAHNCYGGCCLQRRGLCVARMSLISRANHSSTGGIFAGCPGRQAMEQLFPGSY
jgi:hypothetical protein